MPSYGYDSLGSITGIQTNLPTPYAERGRNHERFQTFVIQCNPSNPFSGVVQIQGRVDDPTIFQETTPGGPTIELSNPPGAIWVPLAVITFTDEGGRMFLQLDIKVATVRAACTAYTSGNLLSIKAMR